MPTPAKHLPAGLPTAAALLRNTTTRTGPRQLTCRSRIPTAAGARGYATERQNGQRPERPDFKGQLYDSVALRLQREREEQARFASQRQLGGSKMLAGVFVALCAGVTGYVVGSSKPDTFPESSTTPLASAPPLRHNVAPANLEAAWTDLRDIVGVENISTDPADLAAHAGSEWSSHPQVPGADVPFCIVRPNTTEEVSAIMKVCHTRRIPVTAYSGGTSLEGHFAATRGGVCVDFSRMDRILALHKDDLDVVVQPAVGWETLNEELSQSGLFFPPDPGPGAQIGGMIGTGCSGTNAYRYGTMRDWVINLTVVLADGTVVKTRQRPRKSSAGYDLTRLFIGSEGTLGLVTEATLKVTPQPQNVSVAVCSFGSIAAAAACVGRVVSAGVPIAAIEILDDVQMRCINAAGATDRRWAEAPTLFFKFAGTPTGVQEHIAQVRQLAQASGSRTFAFARSPAEMASLWSARKEALWSVLAQRRDPTRDRVWTTDVAVPLSRLPALIEATQADLRRSGLLGSIVGHVGDGNFHAILLYDAETEHAVAEGVVHRMVKRAIEMDGTATGEHGVGLVKRDYLPHELGPEAVDAMRRLKLAFDPLCLLNCDKIVRVQRPAKGEVAEW